MAGRRLCGRTVLAAGEWPGWSPGWGLTIARSGLLSRKTVAGLEQTLSSAGMRGSGALGTFVGAKLLLLAVLPLTALFVLPHFGLSPIMRNLGIAGAAVVGLLAPDWWVGRRHAKYLRAVQQGLPDALDMMVICAEAGLGFEPALTRVGPRNPSCASRDCRGIRPDRQ